MNIFALEKYDDSGNVCTFYTVRWDDSELNETDKFILKYASNNKFKRPLQELATFLTEKIGNSEGALDEFFRFENDAHALPPSGEHMFHSSFKINYLNFPLRLYCLKLTNYLVVLFSGSEKTSSSAQKGNTSITFYEANMFAKKINNALKNQEIYITENQRELKNFDGSDLILL